MRAVVLLVLLAGCPAPGPGAEDIEGDLLARRTLPDGGVLVVPPDLRTRTITVLSEAGTGFTSTAAEGREDGTFIVRNPPQGRYLIVAGDILVSTTTRRLRLGDNQAGRPDIVFANPGEGLRLTASNLAPWTPDDELQLASWNAGIDFFSTAGRSTPFTAGAPDGGDTALAGAVLDLEGEPAIQASRGDELTVVQLSASALDGGVLVKVASRVARPTVELKVGEPTEVAVALQTVAAVPVRARVDTPAFVALGPSVAAAAQPFEARWVASAHLGPFGRNTVSAGAPDLAIVTAPSSQLVDVPLQLGNPYPASWEPFVTAAVAFEALYRAPQPDGGLSGARSEVAAITRVASLVEALGGPITPLVGPVTDVRIDGAAEAALPTQVGRTPVVSWVVPDGGAVSFVDIQPVELQPGPITRRVGGSTLRVVGDVRRVRLPPNHLTPGAYVYLRLTAVAEPAAWDATQPRRDVGPPAGSATHMTPAFYVEPLP